MVPQRGTGGQPAKASASELASAPANCSPCGDFVAALSVNSWRPSAAADKGGEVRWRRKLACVSRRASPPVRAAGPDRGRFLFVVFV